MLGRVQRSKRAAKVRGTHPADAMAWDDNTICRQPQPIYGRGCIVRSLDNLFDTISNMKPHQHQQMRRPPVQQCPQPRTWFAPTEPALRMAMRGLSRCEA